MRRISRYSLVVIVLIIFGGAANSASSLVSSKLMTPKLPMLVPDKDPDGGAIPDPCEGLPVITTSIASMAVGTCGIENTTGCSHGPKEVIPLEPGCYKQDVTLRPLKAPGDPAGYPDPVIVLVGRDPDKTIIVGQGTQDAVIRFLPNASGEAGGEVHGIKIKPTTNQYGVYFQNAAMVDGPAYANGSAYPDPESVVQNVIIEGGRSGVVMNGYTGKVINTTLIGAWSHAIISQNNAVITATNNLITQNGGSALYPNGTPTYFTATYNDIWRNANNNQTQLPVGSNNLFIDPQVYSGPMYKLRPTSPLIGAGVLDAPTYIGNPTPPTTNMPVDIGAYGKNDFSTPYATTILKVSRFQPYVYLSYLYGYDDVEIQWYGIYRSASVNGPWTFDHSCLKGPYTPTDCPQFIIQNDPPPSPTDQYNLGAETNAMLYTKLVPLDPAYNFGEESNAAAPPTEPVPFQWAVNRSSAACNSSVDVKIRFIGFAPKMNIPSYWGPNITDAIDQMVIWHCWKSDSSWNTCSSATAGFINQPKTFTWYGMRVPCDTKAHYYLFRAVEKTVLWQTNSFLSFSVNRMSMAYYPNYVGTPAPAKVPTPLRICMVDPDTCNDCQFGNNCTTPDPRGINPCPDNGICPEVPFPAPNLSPVGNMSTATPNVASTIDEGGEVYTDPSSGIMYQMAPNSGTVTSATASQPEPNRCPVGDKGWGWDGNPSA